MAGSRYTDLRIDLLVGCMSLRGDSRSFRCLRVVQCLSGAGCDHGEFSLSRTRLQVVVLRILVLSLSLCFFYMARPNGRVTCGVSGNGFSVEICGHASSLVFRYWAGIFVWQLCGIGLGFQVLIGEADLVLCGSRAAWGAYTRDLIFFGLAEVTSSSLPSITHPQAEFVCPPCYQQQFVSRHGSAKRKKDVWCDRKRLECGHLWPHT